MRFFFVADETLSLSRAYKHFNETVCASRALPPLYDLFFGIFRRSFSVCACGSRVFVIIDYSLQLLTLKRRIYNRSCYCYLI